MPNVDGVTNKSATICITPWLHTCVALGACATCRANAYVDDDEHHYFRINYKYADLLKKRVYSGLLDTLSQIRIKGPLGMLVMMMNSIISIHQGATRLEFQDGASARSGISSRHGALPRRRCVALPGASLLGASDLRLLF